MTRDDHDEIDVHVANDAGADVASGDDDVIPLSLTVKLIPIVRLLARQAAREWYQAANDNRDVNKDRLED